MESVLYIGLLWMLANLAIGDTATAGAIGWVVTGLCALAFVLRRLAERRKAQAARAAPAQPAQPKPNSQPQAPAMPRDSNEVRAMRLWLRSLGREDAALSDSEVRALVDVIIHICRHGHITRQTLGGGRLRITVEVTDTGRLGRRG